MSSGKKPSAVAVALCSQFNTDIHTVKCALSADWSRCSDNCFGRHAALAVDAAISAAVAAERERVITAVRQDIGTEYARSNRDGWRATSEALERLDSKLLTL